MITDQNIVHSLSTNKKVGFQTLFDRYYRPMCIYGAKYIHSVDVVEDIVQDLFVKIWDRDDYKALENLRAYLFTAVKNACLSYIRKNKPEHLEDLDFSWEKDLYIQVDDDEDIQNKIDQVQAAIDKLPPACADVFNLVVLTGLKYQEAADELDISINTVKSQLKRAHRLLDEHLHLVILLLC